jgi:hypothetical protein
VTGITVNGDLVVSTERTGRGKEYSIPAMGEVCQEKRGWENDKRASKLKRK